MTIIKARIIMFLVALPLSYAFAVVFSVLWFLFRTVFFGFGDSGPAWVNTANKVVQVFAVIVCLVGSQVLCSYAHKKGKL
jgi:Na+-driven multidrug efflux pump